MVCEGRAPPSSVLLVLLGCDEDDKGRLGMILAYSLAVPGERGATLTYSCPWGPAAAGRGREGDVHDDNFAVPKLNKQGDALILQCPLTINNIMRIPSSLLHTSTLSSSPSKNKHVYHRIYLKTGRRSLGVTLD